MKGATTVEVYNLAQWLHDELEARGWLTEGEGASRESARKIGVERSALNNILNGGGPPDVATFLDLGRFFKTDPLILMKLAGLSVEGLEISSPEEWRALALMLKARRPLFGKVINQILSLPNNEQIARALLAFLLALQEREPDPPPEQDDQSPEQSP